MGSRFTSIKKATADAIGECYDHIEPLPEAKEAHSEAVNLVNDSLNLLLPATMNADAFVKLAFPTYVTMILMPGTYGIYYNFVLGNLQACYLQLRAILESTIKLSFVDIFVADGSFFAKRLESLEHVLREKRLTISEFTERYLEDSFGTRAKEIALELWRRLSQEWVHSKGLVNRIIDAMSEQKFPLAPFMPVPMPYCEGDRELLLEFREDVTKFRILLSMIADKWVRVVSSARDA
jgi:hypothetical protein